MEKLYAGNRGLLAFWVRHYQPMCNAQAVADADDLLQAGFLGLCEASTTYDAEKGAAWSTWASYHIRKAMRGALGLYKGSPEPLVISLDDAAYKGDDDPDSVSLGDTIADATIPPIDDAMLEDELARVVRDAVTDLKDDKQRDFIKGKYFDGLSNDQLSARLGVNKNSLGHVRGKALLALARDRRLHDYMGDDLNFISRKSAAAFYRDLTSDTERLALMIVERKQGRGAAGT